MKKILFLILISVCICCTNTTQTKNNSREQFIKDSIAREQFIKDSIAREQFIKDSIKQVNEKIINNIQKHFTIKKDEFSNLSWVTPKSAPKYRDSNGVYCYFKLEDNKASNFRFVFQHYDNDWLFIKELIFNIDGENISIAPNMERDCGYGGKIWEWCDENVDYGFNYNLNGDFIKKIANAKNIKVKMNGSQYYQIKQLSDKQINDIKNAYIYYIALGGTFK